MYGRNHKKPWRTKGKKNRPIRKERLPGEDPNNVTTSTDTFVSSVPGIIPQSTGTLMTAKYTAGIVFVDHDSGMCYVQNQINQTEDSAKEANRIGSVNWHHTIREQHITIQILEYSMQRNSLRTYNKAIRISHTVE